VVQRIDLATVVSVPAPVQLVALVLVEIDLLAVNQVLVEALEDLILALPVVSEWAVIAHLKENPLIMEVVQQQVNLRALRPDLTVGFNCGKATRNLPQAIRSEGLLVAPKGVLKWHYIEILVKKLKWKKPNSSNRTWKLWLNSQLP
jgi:hypothetical protein